MGVFPPSLHGMEWIGWWPAFTEKGKIGLELRLNFVGSTLGIHRMSMTCVLVITFRILQIAKFLKFSQLVNNLVCSLLESASKSFTAFELKPFMS